jgi:hypothetical protein
MPQDANGTEIQVGDVVTCKFRVTNFVADSDKLNVLAEHFKGHKGLPDDYRIPLEAREVEVIESADRPEQSKPEGKAGHEHTAGDKKHAKENHDPEGKPEHEHSQHHYRNFRR